MDLNYTVTHVHGYFQFRCTVSMSKHSVTIQTFAHFFIFITCTFVAQGKIQFSITFQWEYRMYQISRGKNCHFHNPKVRKSPVFTFTRKIKTISFTRFEQALFKITGSSFRMTYWKFSVFEYVRV